MVREEVANSVIHGLGLLATGRFAILSTVTYVLMGWLCIIAAKPIIVLLSPGALALLAPGASPRCPKTGTTFGSLV